MLVAEFEAGKRRPSGHNFLPNDPASTGNRLSGASKMNFAALLVHGLSALSVFGDIVGARLLAASAGVAWQRQA